MRHPLAKGTRQSDLFRERNHLPRNRRLPMIFRMPGEQAGEVVAVEGARDAKTAMAEAVLLIADEPLAPRKLAKAAGLADAAEARTVLQQLNELYDRAGTAFRVEEIAGGFQLLTRPQYHRWVAHCASSADEIKLSGAAKETLAIVAYRQPIMRADVEAIRGVQSSETLRQLMEKGLIRIAGRHDSLGRPVLYGTTKKFLQVFGLKNLRELPKADELKEPDVKRKAQSEVSAKAEATPNTTPENEE